MGRGRPKRGRGIRANEKPDSCWAIGDGSLMIVVRTQHGRLERLFIVAKTKGLTVSATALGGVQEPQMTLHEEAKRSLGSRFYALYDNVVCRDALSFAHSCCKASSSAAVIDDQTFENIEARVWGHDAATKNISGLYQRTWWLLRRLFRQP